MLNRLSILSVVLWVTKVLTKTKVKQAFAISAPAYDEVAGLQRQVGRALLRQFGAVPIETRLLDLGCGTGFMLAELLDRQRILLDAAIAIDIAEPMLMVARKRLHDANITYLCADAECLPLQAQSIDMVISNLALQWCRNLGEVFAEVSRVLTAKGRFGFSTFGSQTLQELKQAWQEVDEYQHVNDFYQAEEIYKLLINNGYSICDSNVLTYPAYYASVYDLMAELKQLGARTVMARQNPKLTGKAAMQRMVSAYQRAENGQIPATFEVISVLAQKRR